MTPRKMFSLMLLEGLEAIPLRLPYRSDGIASSRLSATLRHSRVPNTTPSSTVLSQALSPGSSATASSTWISS